MHYRDYVVSRKRIPKLTIVKKAKDLDSIKFVDGIAEVEVPVDVLEYVPLKNQARSDSARLRDVIQSIRNNGYSSVDPIIARIGALGRWVVVDGGHRITAAERVSKEFFTNMWGRKVGNLTFILFETPMSYTKLSKHPTKRKDDKRKKKKKKSKGKSEKANT